jgi:hypothetical protein
MSIDISFCRLLLAGVLAEVRQRRPNVRLRDAWVYKVGRDHWEFHYGDYYWHGSAGNAYEARARGWEAWLNREAA